MQKFAVIVCAALVLAIVSASPAPPSASKLNFNLDQEWYTIPKVGGGMELMSRQQIVDHVEYAISPRFDVSSDVKYNLHTRTNPDGVRIFLDDEEGLAASGFNAAHPVRFTAHGWNGGTTSTVNAVSEFLQAGEFNHIVIDWNAGAETLNYIDARNRVPEVAKHAGLMAGFLVRRGSSWSQIYAIGHSLGGQMAGLIGQYLEEGEIAACICLDPAGPLFSSTDINDRASPDDCKYVEVIHTNGGTLGFLAAIGDSDFYPNGGKSQPGCGIDLVGSCAHERAPVFFAESLIAKTAFEAWQCNSTVDDLVKGNCEQTGATSTMMGDPVNYNAKGLYYLTTGSESPFVQPLA